MVHCYKAIHSNEVSMFNRHKVERVPNKKYLGMYISLHATKSAVEITIIIFVMQVEAFENVGK